MEPENNFVFAQVSCLNKSTEAQKIPYATTYSDMSVHFHKMLFLPLNQITKIYLQSSETGSICSF